MKIGVLGAGQLGRMLALEGLKYGIDFRFWDPTPESCAAQLGEFVCAPFSDEAALQQFLIGLDVVTFEFENIPVDLIEEILASVPVRPGAEILRQTQDRLLEKQFIHSLRIPIAPFAATTSATIEDAIDLIGPEGILKTRRMGYDGKGQFRFSKNTDISQLVTELANVDYVFERLIPFHRELSIIGARGIDGLTRFYPLIENVHRAGILRTSEAPAPNVSVTLQTDAERIATAIMNASDYIGVMAVELFETADGLIVNEVAPRVHNSGHWTLDGANISQFDLHIRAITGLPLPEITTSGLSLMRNLIGALPSLPVALADPDVFVHFYGKSPKPGRKVGHLTLCGEGESLVRSRFEMIDQMVYGIEN